jgi:predicted transcriptional regulator
VNTLFELRSDNEMRRDAVADNESRIHEALLGHGPWELSESQRKLLEALRGRQGRLQARSIENLMSALGSNPRSIKADVRELVMSFRLPIVASRDGETGGYFFAVSAEERVRYSADYVKEAVALLSRAAIIRNDQDMSALLGQVSIEIGAAKEEK